MATEPFWDEVQNAGQPYYLSQSTQAVEMVSWPPDLVMDG